MTWEELVNWIKTLSYLSSTIRPECSKTDPDYIVLPVSGQMFGDSYLFFYKDGTIKIDMGEEIRYYILYKNRTPDQMYTIIKALTDKGE